jgi:hypothetical protein
MSGVGAVLVNAYWLGWEEATSLARSPAFRPHIAHIPLVLFPEHDHGGVLITILLHHLRDSHFKVLLRHMNSSLT